MRILSNTEKEALRADQNFKEACKWGLLNKAEYWKGLDGSGGVPGDDFIRWAKSRSYAAQIRMNPQSIDPVYNPQVIDRFLVYMKNVSCVDENVAFDTATVIQELNKKIGATDSNQFDVLADTFFNDQISQTLF